MRGLMSAGAVKYGAGDTRKAPPVCLRSSRACRRAADVDPVVLTFYTVADVLASDLMAFYRPYGLWRGMGRRCRARTRAGAI